MATRKRDYVDIARDYARSAIRDKQRKKHGELFRLAAQRFLDDLGRARKKTCPFIFDRWHANDVCDFIEKLPHVEGKWDSPTIVLHPSHVFFLVQLFGFRKRKPIEVQGYGQFRPRRYTSALFSVARKNAKSTLAAGVLLYCQSCEPEEGAQVISAATTYDQASIIFKIAKRMVEKTPALREHFGLETWAKAISRYEAGGTFKPVHAKASTQDGLNPSHTALDEIHAHKTPDLLNVLTSAAGARINPLWLYTTTEGYINPGPWGELRQFGRKLLGGIFKNTADHFLVVIFACDEEDKDKGIQADKEFNSRIWVKANPLIEVNPILKEEIRKAAIEAKQMPSKMAEFRIKRLNRQASTAAGWINLDKWRVCEGEVDLKWLKPHPCYGGLDLASTTDLAALRLVWIIDGILYTHGWRWVPESAVAYRTERGTVPYAGWVESGQLKQTEGDVTDYAVIEADILEIKDTFNIQRLGYDKWNALDLINRLVPEFPKDVLLEFIQGTKSYHPAMQTLEHHYVSGNLAHGGDEVLNWCASNLVARTDVNLNLAPDKKKCADKIDDMTALLMAVGVSQSGETKKESKYKRGGSLAVA